MKKILQGFLVALVTTVMVAILALLTGSIVHLLWPIVIPVVLPGLVSKDIIAGTIPWWNAFCLCWLIGILFQKISTTKD